MDQREYLFEVNIFSGTFDRPHAARFPPDAFGCVGRGRWAETHQCARAEQAGGSIV